MTLLDLPARPLSPSTLPPFTRPISTAATARKKASAKITVQPAVRVTAGPNPVAAVFPAVEPAQAAPAAARKAPARKRTRKFVPDLLAKEIPARHVATMDSFALNTALDYMFPLDEHTADLEVIARKRSE